MKKEEGSFYLHDERCHEESGAGIALRVVLAILSIIAVGTTIVPFPFL